MKIVHSAGAQNWMHKLQQAHSKKNSLLIFDHKWILHTCTYLATKPVFQSPNFFSSQNFLVQKSYKTWWKVESTKCAKIPFLQIFVYWNWHSKLHMWVCDIFIQWLRAHSMYISINFNCLFTCQTFFGRLKSSPKSSLL